MCTEPTAGKDLELFKFKKNYLFSVQLLQSTHNSPVVASEDVGHLGWAGLRQTTPAKEILPNTSNTTKPDKRNMEYSAR